MPPRRVAVPDARAAAGAESIWQAHRAELVRFMRRRVRDAALAEDLAHEVLCKAHERRASLREDVKLRAWLYRIARRVLADHFRARRPPDPLPDDLADRAAPAGTSLGASPGARAGASPGLSAGAPAHAAGEDPDAAGRELARCLRPLMDELPASAREALLLAELQGLPQREVARRLGLSLTAVKSRVQRARRQLAGALLRCCRVEVDRRGGVVDYASRRPRRRACSGSC